VIGIIDIFTEFNSRKKLEYYYKRVKYAGNTMSCVPPDMYAERFLEFMKRCLRVKN
jgi:1-phosphatidylinositol-4-phosphate 5-kinase